MANPKDVDILILGNGGVALSALRTIRARNKDLRVLLVSKEKESFYAPVLLPYYISGESLGKSYFHWMAIFIKGVQ